MDTMATPLTGKKCPAAAVNHRTGQSGMRKMRVLLADDHPNLLQNERRLLDCPVVVNSRHMTEKEFKPGQHSK